MKSKFEYAMRENIFTIPNALCITRIGLTPFISYYILDQNYLWALGLFSIAGVTDFFDGLIARLFPSQRSMIGSFLDPAADKLLIASLFLSLTYVGIIPVPLTLLIVSRDAFLMGAGFYIRYQSLAKPRTLSRYFNPSIASAQLSPTFISKVNTAIQLGLVATSLGAPILGYTDHLYLKYLWYLTASTTVASILSYGLQKNTYQFLRKRKRKTF